MIWKLVEQTFDDYFSREDFQFEIHHGGDVTDTECSAVIKMDKGLREQKIRIYFENEDNINFLRIISPLVSVDRCTTDQLIRMLEQNISWVNTSVGVVSREVVYTCVVPVREFEADSAVLGDAIVKLARRADQMETLLFGRDRKNKLG
jgi:hypothetical protein